MKKKIRKNLPVKLFILIAMLGATIVAITLGELLTSPPGFSSYGGASQADED